MTPTVGMAMIVRDEADRIERCLASWWEHVDVAAIVDTGSTDDTMTKVRAYAAAHPGTELREGRFEWCDDFAAARNHADDLLAGVDWRCWVDADDTITGAHHLHAIADAQPANVQAVACGYNYAQHDGKCICYLRRERLIRMSAGLKWAGAVHEATAIPSHMPQLGPELIEWVHDATVEGRERTDRNVRILTRWHDREPKNARVVSYLGAEALSGGDMETAVHWFALYLQLEDGWPEERAQVHRRHAQALAALGRLDDAETTALKALTVQPDWPDSTITLAEVAYSRKDWVNAIRWATRTIDAGPPQTMLIVNPMDYTWLPRVIRAGARGALGDWAGAIEDAETALEQAPHDQLQAHYGGWRRAQRADEAADLTVRLAQTLVAHDEQLKALRLLEDTVPYFATDHASVVGARHQVRERLLFITDPALYAQHYTDHDEKGADEPDTVAGLSRARFLIDGLREQLTTREAPVGA